MGPGFCPEIMRKAGGGCAGDQTNAMLATSKEVILPRRTPALLLRPQAAQHGVSFALRELLAAPRNRPQIAAQRLDRVDRDDFSGTLQIDTIGTIQLNHSFSIAAANRCLNPVFS